MSWFDFLDASDEDQRQNFYERYLGSSQSAQDETDGECIRWCAGGSAHAFKSDVGAKGVISVGTVRIQICG